MDHINAKSTGTAEPVLPRVCAACAVRNSSLCGALSDEELRDLSAISTRKGLTRGQFHAFETGDRPEFVNVTSGCGKLVKGSPDGRQQIVGLLFPSDFVSNHANGAVTNANTSIIEAATSLELCLFPRDRVDQLMARHPKLANRLLALALDELSVARDWMVLLGRKSAAERVASFLLHVSRRMTSQSCGRVAGFELPLDRADIADHIGLTVETVSRQISKLRLDGVIKMEGTRRIVDMDEDSLAERAGIF
ncbi:MAG: Crp/Fnr family transcriptional regulator [Pseudomonadota bacterium]